MTEIANLGRHSNGIVGFPIFFSPDDNHDNHYVKFVFDPQDDDSPVGLAVASNNSGRIWLDRDEVRALRDQLTAVLTNEELATTVAPATPSNITVNVYVDGVKQL